jgi:hypothetical protein
MAALGIEKKLGSHHRDTLILKFDLAAVYEAQGRHAKASALFTSDFTSSTDPGSGVRLTYILHHNHVENQIFSSRTS